MYIRYSHIEVDLVGQGFIFEPHFTYRFQYNVYASKPAIDQKVSVKKGSQMNKSISKNVVIDIVY